VGGSTLCIKRENTNGGRKGEHRVKLWLLVPRAMWFAISGRSSFEISTLKIEEPLIIKSNRKGSGKGEEHGRGASIINVTGRGSLD